jgi:hypothetical protein
MSSPTEIMFVASATSMWVVFAVQERQAALRIRHVARADVRRQLDGGVCDLSVANRPF